MKRPARCRIRTCLWLLAATVVLTAVYFAPVLFEGKLFYSGDIARIYLPQRVALSGALVDGQIPWWSSDVGIGYPLLAEGEIGALYPPNWLLYRWLTPEVALSLSVVLHYLLTGVGFYLYARSLGLAMGPAYLGSMVWVLGGFNIAHLSHVSIVTVAAWLPWMLLWTQRVLSVRGASRAWQCSVTLAITVGMQFLAGHPQMSLLSMLLVSLYGLTLLWHRRSERRAPNARCEHSIRRALLWGVAMGVGVLLGLPQILPAAQLGALSGRAGGLESTFFTSYSLHPYLLATYLSPFLLGSPYPLGSVELMGYVGLLPLGLSLVALRVKSAKGQRLELVFYLVIGLAGLFFAFGRWNPLYRYLQHVPVLNLFRVPARYLYWTSLALATLAAIGAAGLLRGMRRRKAHWDWAVVGYAVILLVAALYSVSRVQDADALVAGWHWLSVLLLFSGIVLYIVRRRMARTPWIVAVCIVAFVDLYAYGAVLGLTFSATVPSSAVSRPPDSLQFFREQEGLYRIYTKDEIVPALSVMRESYYPNLGLTHGLSSANIYLPLVPREYGAYLRGLDAERLNRLNVRYYLIPQLLPVDEESELYDVLNPYASVPTGTWLSLPEMQIDRLEIESYLSHSTERHDGELAAELVFRDDAGEEWRVPLRVGLDTAEWAYERDDVRAAVAHSLPVVATSWPSRSGFPPQEHQGHTYLASAEPPAPFSATACKLVPVFSDAFIRIERVRVTTTDHHTHLLTHLVGLADHTIVYRTEDVVIYRNEDALPRAYTLPASRVAGKENLALPAQIAEEEVGGVTVVSYQEQRVEIEAVVDEPSYLVLADLYYPGWYVSVDARPADMLCIDTVFRAVYLSSGEHRVVFSYRPSWRLR